jgi:hypothetical protein
LEYSTYSDGREEAMEPVAQLIEPNISKSTSATPGSLSSQVTDTIEVKMTVANAQIGDALRKFDLRVDEEEKRYVYFFDTPERDLLEAGIIARARRIVGDQHNSTVKFRPVEPGAVSRRWRKFEGFKIEADASEKGVDNPCPSPGQSSEGSSGGPSKARGRFDTCSKKSMATS